MTNVNCNNVFNQNNLPNLENVNYTNETLTINWLLNLHGVNNFNAVPRIICMVRNNPRNFTTVVSNGTNNIKNQVFSNMSNTVKLKLINNIIKNRQITQHDLKTIKYLLNKGVQIKYKNLNTHINILNKKPNTPNRTSILNSLKLKKMRQKGLIAALSTNKIKKLPLELRMKLASYL